MPKQSKNQTPLRLLTSVPSKDHSRLVVRYPYQTDAQYAHAYHFAAQRLATTFGGEPIDDLLLLPFLTLYRQAFELQLKNTIRSLVSLRANYLVGWTDDLTEAISEERFRKELGHNLYKLLNEAKKHFTILDLPDAFPESVEQLIIKLHEADQAGTAFRYAGLLPDTQEYADFPDLASLLNDDFEMLSVVIDYAEGCYQAMPTLRELQSEMY